MTLTRSLGRGQACRRSKTSVPCVAGVLFECLSAGGLPGAGCGAGMTRPRAPASQRFHRRSAHSRVRGRSADSENGRGVSLREQIVEARLVERLAEELEDLDSPEWLQRVLMV